MKIVFFHGHKFRFDGHFFSSAGGLSESVLLKYIGEKDQLTVYARIVPQQSNEDLMPILDRRITIRPYSEVDLNKVIAQADLSVIRLPSLVGFKACKIARKLQKPYFVEVVGCIFDAFWNYGIKGKIAAIPGYFLMRDCVRRAPIVTYVTKEFLQRRYPCKGNSVSLSDVALPEANEQVLHMRLKKLREKKTKLILGTAASVDVQYKGQEYVIQAIPEIAEKLGITVEYQLAGGGNPDRLLEVARQRGVSDSICIKGAIPHDDIFAWLDSLDIYLQPSLLEGLSRAVIEAMSRGLPCIVTDCGGNFELIDKEYRVHTFSRRKLADLIADKVIELSQLSNQEAQSIRNYELVKQEYSKELLNEKWDAFYNDVKKAAVKPD